jgi:hypothetical protein
MPNDTESPAARPYELPRRRLFKYVVNSIGAAIAAMLAVPLGGFFAIPALRKREPVWKELGPVSDFPIGEIKLAPLKPLTRANGRKTGEQKPPGSTGRARMNSSCTTFIARMWAAL